MKRLLTIIAMYLTVQITYAERRIVGDINNDGKISVKDITELIKILVDKSAAYVRVADVNNDKKIDKDDVEKLSQIILKKSPIEYYEYIEGSNVEDDVLPKGDKWD